MSETTKEELLAFMRKHGPEKIDSITDTESAIRHFRCTSKVYKEQRDQYKAERDKFEKMLNKECECGYKLEGQLHDMTKQRDTLIDDLSWYKAKVSRLERENEELQGFYRDLRVECYRYHEAFEKIEDRYTTLTNHIRMKAENNPGVSRYIDLVNYIDRLERADDERKRI